MTTDVERSGGRRAALGHWTVKEYDRAFEAGIFGIDPKIELLLGQIYPTRDIGDNGLASMGAPHAAAVQYLTRAAIRFFDVARVSCQTPIILNDQSEPEPDLWVARSTSSPKPMASDLFLAIEVADTSIAYDRWKATHYIESGVPEVWVVDLAERAVWVSTPDSVDQRFGRVFDLGRLLTHPATGFSVDLDELFA